MQTLLLVGLGGGMGAMLRYSLTLAMSLLPVSFFNTGIWAVLFVNNLGSFIAGILAEKIRNDDLRFMLISGFLGSFTTFSAFSREGMGLFYQKNWFFFAGFVFLNVAGSLISYHWGYHWNK